MISRFSVILLCLSGVYCVSSVFDYYLDLNGLKQAFNRQIAIAEWNTAMDQQIIYQDANGTNTRVINVKTAVEYFMQNPDNSTAAELEWIRNIIKTAYECTLTRYASLTSYLIFQELWEHKTNLHWAINHTDLNSSNFDIRSVYRNEKFQQLYDSIEWDKNILDFDINLETGGERIRAVHRFHTKPKEELHNLWAGLIGKKLGLTIKYKIYTEVMKTRFANEYNIPFVDALNELVCVLNEAIQLFDSSIVDKCVPHDSSFVNNFESLKTGVSGDFMWLLEHFDATKAREASKDGQHLKYNPEGKLYLEARDTNSELYRDFSKSIPGIPAAYPEIRASGCFVENLQFEISGLKTDYKNSNEPTDIYGPISYGRTSELKMTLVETTRHAKKRDVKIGMIMFRDKDKSFHDHTQSSKHTILDEFRETCQIN
ncbi:uncharacterized protein LOC126838697 [Adelges cooleyi]|uniref:uncharacterized protein LOC126838697 n=1 Tax=Adelges cooleyi TaxID=133065 RepID=UPI00218015D1|nr:uncharacterized protein LOC126838697 [Adelges cooleyi]